MKRFLLTFFCIAAISGGVFYAVSVPHDRLIQASAGVLDLRSADLDEDAYRLGGEWEFYWGRLYEPKDFIKAQPEGRAFIPVPYPWNRAGYPITGFATYRLTLLTPSGAKLMMYVPEILRSAVIWVNGEKVFSAGQVGTDRESAAPYGKSDIVILPAYTNVGDAAHGVPLEIIVQVSNYDEIYGGIQHPFRVGTASTLPRAVFSRWLLLACVVGAFLIIGLYHLALFMSRDKADSNLIYLVFAMHCILGGLRFLFDFDSIAQYFLSNSLNARFNFIYAVLTALHVIFIVLFALLALEIKLKPRTKTAIAVMLGLPLVLMPILPFPLSFFISFLCVVLAIFMIILMAARSLSLARVRNRPYLGLYFISLVCFALWGPIANSIAHAYFFAATLLSNTFFTLSQFIMLSQDFAEARRKARELAAKNDFHRRMSHDLRTPLTKVSTNIQTARRRPQEADVLLAKSQDEIMKMAGMIDDALSDGDEAYL